MIHNIVVLQTPTKRGQFVETRFNRNYQNTSPESRYSFMAVQNGSPMRVRQKAGQPSHTDKIHDQSSGPTSLCQYMTSKAHVVLPEFPLVLAHSVPLRRHVSVTCQSGP
jgi:hypothetical protein